jgi:hypothetical protein
MGWTTDELGMFIGWVNTLVSSPKTSTQVLGPTQPITLFLGVKR